MNRKPKNADPTASSAMDLLAGIRSKQIAPETLPIDSRREVVMCLAAEGASTAEIAQLLRVTDRTIRRDLEHLRADNALRVTDEFPEQLAGELIAAARASHARLVRMSRDKKASVAARVSAEREAYEVMDHLVERLQSLGFAPSATHRVQADLTHNFGEVPSLDALSRQIEQLSALAIDDPAEQNELRELAALTERANEVPKADQASTPEVG